MLQHLILQIVLIVQGIGAASGIVSDGHFIYLISDDDTRLFITDQRTKQTTKVDLIPSMAGIKMTKKNKPDFEALTKEGAYIYALGSGSKINRNDFIAYHLPTEKVTRYSTDELFQSMMQLSGIPSDEFNIEGMTSDGEKSYFLNRGNGASGMNGLFIVQSPLKSLMESPSEMKYVPIPLPVFGDFTTGFSDGVVVDGMLFFTATVEESKDVIDDGKINGSYIGRLNLTNFQVEEFVQISKDQKIEGITLLKQTAQAYTFLLCADNDDKAIETNVFQVDVQKK